MAGKKNIFRGAVLGDVFKTERGHKLAFCGKGTSDDTYILVDRHAKTFYYRSTGEYYLEGHKRNIVSKISKDTEELKAPTYKDLEEESKRAYPDEVRPRLAFRRGAIWFMRETCPEVEESMGLPYITLDENAGE